MKSVLSAAFVACSALVPAMFGENGLVPADLTVGQNLEIPATVGLSEPAPSGGLRITLTSNDPKLVLLSRSPEDAGAPSIDVTVTPGLRTSRQFYIQGFANSGSATYTASASGFPSGTGKVTLAPSGILLSAGSGGLSAAADSLMTTIDAEVSNVRIYPALLDSSYNYVARQMVAGGLSLTVDVTSSNPAVGSITTSAIKIPGGYASATTQFLPATVGDTTIAATVPPGFSAPARFGKLSATVMLPGIGLTDEKSIGNNLQVCDGVFFAKAAPHEVHVTLTSDNAKLLLSPSGANAPKSESVSLTIPAGGTKASFCMESLADSGLAKITASAPGYRSRTENLTLTPSGVLLGFAGPPDEAELFRKEAAEKEHGIVTRLSSGVVNFQLSVAQLDPKTHRGADITVEPLRPGMTATLELKSSNPAVGTITSPVTVVGVGGSAEFKPLHAGKTVITLATPDGFTVPGNANAYTVIVTE